MILRNLVLQKIEGEFGTLEALINILQRHPKLSGDDKSILDGFIIIGNNILYLEYPLMDDIYFYKDISCYLLDRLRIIYDESCCVGVGFLIELMVFVSDYAKPLRRLA